MGPESAGAETSRATAPKRQTNRVTSERIISPPRERPLVTEGAYLWNLVFVNSVTVGATKTPTVLLELEGFDRASGAGKHILDSCSSLTIKANLWCREGELNPRY